MPRHPFYWIDAFTDQRLGGNPCAVVLDAGGLSPIEMQAIAKEMNLSETAFVTGGGGTRFSARYFTPGDELPFAGHPTIAVAHALIQSGKATSPATGPIHLTIDVPAGPIPVEATLGGASSTVSMTQLEPMFLRTYSASDVLPIFSLSESDLIPGAPIQTVSTGSPILMIPLASHDALRRARFVDIAAYHALRTGGDFLFTHHFCLQGATDEGTTFARSLDNPPGTSEDPFTGSATGCMAAYLWKHGLVSKPRWIAEQGHWMGRPGQAEVERLGTSEHMTGIRVSGGAVTVVEGALSL